MKILLVYPGYPETFWSFRHALKVIAKKASFPPLGALTVAAMLPPEWEKKLVDMNVSPLSDKDIKWADYVFISAMIVQRHSAEDVIRRANRLGVKVVAGGPLFTTAYQEFKGVSHYVLGEGEVTIPLFLKDLAEGHAEPVYFSDVRPDITHTPAPMWSLVKMKKYTSMSMQYSRGCPFDCEFCDIVLLNGHRVRTKTREQIISELENLYNHGWRGGLFVVDDNFIGNKTKLKDEILPAIIEWNKKRKYVFDFSTEASINLADDDELMKLMVEAGFSRVFIGIETPNEDSLVECNKHQNVNRDLSECVKAIQQAGLEVQGGFIVGFDSDPVSIFKRQIDFIQKSGIVTAMVGLLNAPRGTKLYHRLKRENRLIEDEMSGDNTDCSINFIPKMRYETLIAGYRQIMETIYSPRELYDRMKTFLKNYQPPKRGVSLMATLKRQHIRGLFGSIWFLGIKEKGRRYYWKLFFETLFKSPRKFPITITLSVYGYHFRKAFERYIGAPIGGMVDHSGLRNRKQQDVAQ
ncbi:MAG: B12-binding domain-containing radical SAM protein [Chloroflexota bacterium]